MPWWHTHCVCTYQCEAPVPQISTKAVPLQKPICCFSATGHNCTQKFVHQLTISKTINASNQLQHLQERWMNRALPVRLVRTQKAFSGLGAGRTATGGSREVSDAH